MFWTIVFAIILAFLIIRFWQLIVLVLVGFANVFYNVTISTGKVISKPLHILGNFVKNTFNLCKFVVKTVLQTIFFPIKLITTGFQKARESMVSHPVKFFTVFTIFVVFTLFFVVVMGS